MKTTLFPIISIALILTAKYSPAQKSINTAGGNLFGTGGTCSFTIGQVDYTIIKDENPIWIIEGIQQPSEISSTSKPDSNHDITINWNIFPNPVTHNLTIKCPNASLVKMQASLYSITGKKLLQIDLLENEVTLNMDQLNTGIYLLNIRNDQETVLEYKLIKQEN